MTSAGKPLKIPKCRTGAIVSVAMNQTAVVAVPFVKLSPKYQKRFTRHRRYLAQNAGNDFKVGDEVVIEEARPLSRRKRWRIVSAVKKV